MKTTVPPDFFPDQGKIDLLNAYGMIASPKGDQHCGEWFTTRIDIIAEFLDYWTLRAKEKDRKKTDWQRTYCNYIKNFAWPNELRDYENNRHNRTDSTTGSFDQVNKAYGKLIDTSPVKRKYKIPERPEVEETMSREEGLAALAKITGSNRN